MNRMQVKATKTTAGTYSFSLLQDGILVERVETTATTAVGARVQGLRLRAQIEAVPLPGRQGGSQHDAYRFH